ncbi:hypothetical protein LSUB1_G004230, partial [Lachnellula subtilissima]
PVSRTFRSHVPNSPVVASPLHSCLLPHHHHDGELSWTEPVGYWRKAYRLACLNHTELLQIIMAISPTLHFIIAIADNPQGKRRPKGNNTLNRIKKRLSLSIYFKWLTLPIVSPAIDQPLKGLLRLLVGTRQKL